MYNGARIHEQTALDRWSLSPFLFGQKGYVAPSPEKVSAVDRMFSGTVFFPGGRGLWLEEGSAVFPDILVLGQDFFHGEGV